ncbi:hypothetical protein D9757_003582 [Collybiopsis confluens]|uniref:Tryptophan synthase n=1 Tax=Collybiopsis confluens TaxID=2823264 RepID=A0A8H5MDM6_9AGAR|nr:hypothetical protein D9757_003582 [Collybiopsis confluens]
MQALKDVFSKKKSQGETALVTFITAGYPDKDSTVPLLLAMQNGGADIIELGVPFSDPIADGPVIQESNTIALTHDVDYAVVLGQLRDARSKGLTVPVLLMGYYNPILAYGEDKAIQDASEAGANGFIMVDLPPEEALTFREKCATAQLSYVPLIAPSTTLHRIKFLSTIADSFVYVVSKMGTTGSSDQVAINNALPDIIARVREYVTVPIAVGFGVSNRGHFDYVADSGADGVVIGSRIVTVIKEALKDQRLKMVGDYLSRISLKGQPQKARSPPPPRLSSPTLNASRSGPPIANSTADSIVLPARFGQFGGQYVPEAIVDCLAELEEAHKSAMADPEFWKEFRSHFGYMNRPSELYLAENLTKDAGGAKIWLKREDLNHTGSHKINNAIGQILLAKRIGKTRIIAETGAGQHGVATATVCAKFGLECVIYMGAEDVRRQALNVFRIEMLGGKVIPVHSGSCTLKDAVNEAFRDWVTNLATTHYLVGSAIGPHPFPTIVRDFQKVISQEIKEQLQVRRGKLPEAVVACVGGGSNAIGTFYNFIEDKNVRLIGVEAGGEGTDGDRHSATLSKGQPGVLHGVRTYIMQSPAGQIIETHSISAGLDYPGVGPEHAWLKDSGRAEYISATDEEALRGFRMLTQREGIIPALESSHAIWGAVQLAKTLPKDADIVICLSGRGDKDVEQISHLSRLPQPYHPFRDAGPPRCIPPEEIPGSASSVTFITAGYPEKEDTIPLMLGMQTGGADIIELGIPFSDPMADGPVIQESNMIAVENGMDLAAVLGQLREARTKGLTVPVVLMGYYNPIMAYGEDKAIRDSSEAGANGFIVVDLPPDEASVFRKKCLRVHLSFIPLIAPSTSIDCIRFLSSIADTFVYVVSKMGTTGSSDKVRMNASLPDIIARVRQYVSVPIAVGFGVSNRGHIDYVVESGADGVVIGSRVISIVKKAPTSQRARRVEEYLSQILPGVANGDLPLLSKRCQLDLSGDRGPPPEVQGTQLPAWFGKFGGQYVPGPIADCLAELEAVHKSAMADPEFWKEFRSHYGYMNRPSELYLAENLGKHAGGPRYG